MEIFSVNFIHFRAQNNGRSTDNERPKMPFDPSLFYLTGHFGQSPTVSASTISLTSE